MRRSLSSPLTRMTISNRVALLLVGGILGVLSLGFRGVENVSKGLLRKAAEAQGILVGTLLDHSALNDAMVRTTIANEFTAGIAIVFMRDTQPQPHQFDFREMDAVIQFASANNLKLAGHALMYRLTNPAWLGFNPLWCGGWSKDSLDQVLKNYIQTVVSRGGDHFYVWDVGNELLTPSGNLGRSCWYRVLGEEYIAKAFRYAHAANPRVLLRLNETFGRGGIDARKAEAFFALIHKLKSQGVPVHVAGIQMHLEVPRLRPTYLREFREFLAKAMEIGVQVHITEMDVYQGTPETFARPFETQKAIYKAILGTCLEFAHCTSFATWGVVDTFSWLKTRKKDPYPDARPLLFDDNGSPKPAYFGVVEAIEERHHGDTQ
jgi:endo-1,4-beta-xylanase